MFAKTATVLFMVIAGAGRHHDFNGQPAPLTSGAALFAATATATTGRYIFRDSAQTPIMTASEVLFMKAEASFPQG